MTWFRLICVLAAFILIAWVRAPDASAHIAMPAVLQTVELPDLGTALRVRIGAKDGLFLFDTGSGVTTITPLVAQSVGCHVWGKMTGFRATGERLDFPRCDNVSLALGNRSFIAPSAGVFDINNLLDSKKYPVLSGVIGLDIFAGYALTIRPLAHEVVIETASSLKQREVGALQVPIRVVRDVQGVALSVDGEVPTPLGSSWMELDTGNLGPMMVDRHVAPLLNLKAVSASDQIGNFDLAGGVAVRGPVRVGDFILDGDIGETVLTHWDVTLDLAHGTAWFRPSSRGATPSP